MQWDVQLPFDLFQSVGARYRLTTALVGLRQSEGRGCKRTGKHARRTKYMHACNNTHSMAPSQPRCAEVRVVGCRTNFCSMECVQLCQFLINAVGLYSHLSHKQYLPFREQERGAVFATAEYFLDYRL